MNIPMLILFWFSFCTICYVYFGYPVVVYLISLFYEQSIVRKYVYPSISIVISAYNEEKNIETKIMSLLHLDYPLTRYEILIGSDGSTDNTCAIVEKYEHVKLFKKEKREGKPSMLNLLVSKATGDLIVFTDARQKLDRSALKELARNFSDEKVGSVSAEMFFEDENNKPQDGVGLYWRYEKFIRKAESRIGSMLGATGALYAIRRQLFTPLPPDLILDDVYIPMKIVEKGYRAIFEPKAKIYDKIAANAHEEFKRKARTLAGNYQLFRYLRSVFNPINKQVGFQFVSHKFLRLVVPFLLAVLLASNVALVQKYPLYLFFLELQVIVYVLALLKVFFPRMKNPLVNVPYTFCVMNAAAVVGLFRFLSRKQDVLWEKAAKT